MKNLLTRLDPHKQSCFYFKTSPVTWLILIAVAAWLAWQWRMDVADSLIHNKENFSGLLLRNIFIYTPNYLLHEQFGHVFLGGILFRIFHYNAIGSWFMSLMGNGGETLVPLCLLFVVLRLEGGRWLLPPILYWLASTFYDAGGYVQDARACSLPLTSADMVTNYKPGETCGDWYYILKPIGLLNYDQWFAYAFLFIGVFLFLLALYSAWYYWTHTEQYTYHAPPTPVQDDWTPPNIYTPRPENIPGGKQE